MRIRPLIWAYYHPVGVLRLHSERVNYIAATWKGVTINQLDAPIWCCMVGIVTTQ